MTRSSRAVRALRGGTGVRSPSRPLQAKKGDGAELFGRKRKTSRARLDYVLEDQVGFQLRLAMQRHTAIFVAKMVLTQTQFAAIVKLNEVGPCSQNHLARLIALDAATMNGVLDRLKRRGYISAAPDLRDGRQRVITITDVGRSVVEPAVRAAKKVTAETLAPLSETERAQLSRLLNKIS